MHFDDVLNTFEGKDVILVGNSVEIMNYEYGEFIDSHDVVVRFGKGIEANDKERVSVGKKINVWVTGEFRAPMIKKEPYTTMLRDALILYNKSRIKVRAPRQKIPQLSRSYDMYSDYEILKINESLGITDGDRDARRLSAGLWTIKFLCEKVCNYKSLTLIGFDFFAKTTNKRRGGGTYDPASWHIPINTGLSETHWHDQEVSIVRDYEAQGKLRWKILSDLSEEVINKSKYGRF